MGGGGGHGSAKFHGAIRRAQPVVGGGVLRGGALHDVLEKQNLAYDFVSQALHAECRKCAEAPVSYTVQAGTGEVILKWTPTDPVNVFTGHIDCKFIRTGTGWLNMRGGDRFQTRSVKCIVSSARRTHVTVSCRIRG